MAMTRNRLLRFVHAARAVLHGDPAPMLALPWPPYAELTLEDGCVVTSLDGACLLRLQTIPAR